MRQQINRGKLEAYLARFGLTELLSIRSLGKGAHGEGWLISARDDRGEKELVLKTVRPLGLGHDYPADKAGMFLLAYNAYNRLPRHVRALDVISMNADGGLTGIAGGKEYFLLMEKAEGESYFTDLEEFAKKDALDGADKEKIGLMTGYLAHIHSVKNPDPARAESLYKRRIRDTVGGGECLMGVFDTYPDGTLSPGEMAEIEKKCVDWRARLKDSHRRLCQVHGDFHPGNIRFRKKKKGFDFVLLDRSRGPWGEPADDLTALAINYIFISLKHYGEVRGPYLEALETFFREYIEKTGDGEILGYCAPFFAFRGAVVANPVFYPEFPEEGRRGIFAFVRGVLEDSSFRPERVRDYISSYNIHKPVLF